MLNPVSSMNTEFFFGNPCLCWQSICYLYFLLQENMENNKKNNDSIRYLQIKVVVGMINITNQVKKESTAANLDEPDLILIPTDENNTKTAKKKMT